MRSLALKLTLAFLFVGVVGAVLVAFMVRYQTQRQFNQLVLDQNQQVLINNLTRFYAANGSWEGVESVFRPASQNIESPQVPQGRWEERRTLFALANREGKIVYGAGPGIDEDNVRSTDLKKGIPIEIDGDTVGWLLFIPSLNRWEQDTPEGNFLLEVGRASLWSAIIASLFALGLGGVLAYTMTRSIRELTTATTYLAQGKLGHQVKVRSQDEIGVLAQSFNKMSSDLEQATQLRRQMTADIAHDLRTPLSVILGYTEALNDEKLAGSAEIFSVMHSEAQHLSHLIDDLKVLSLADAGELPLSIQPVPPAGLLRRAADAYRIQAEQKEITLEVDAASDLPEVNLDHERMAQVLGNLITNALRYTPAGGAIRLSAERAGSDVRLQVSDNGRGISAEDLLFVFGRSFRGDKARQQENGETGLGLAIAKSLVEAQGGRISVTSQIGLGSTFRIDLPVSN